MSKKIVLIDGHSILNRAFFGVKDLTNSEGLHTNAVFGFLNILFKILEEEQPEYLTVAFDVHAPTFRHKMYAEYKGTRKPMAEELRQQVPLMKEMLTAMGIRIVELEGYEADDLLGTLSKRAQEEGFLVSVVSGDRDLLQLATDRVKIRIPKTKKTGTEIEDYYAKDVQERYQVTPTQFIDVKALMGDASDNIPGVPGIGEKTAVNLIAAYGSIENAYAHAEEIKPNRAKENLKEHYDMAQLSKTLAAIDVNVPIEFTFEYAKVGNFYTKEAYLLCKRLDFKKMLSRFEVDAPKNTMETYFRKIEDFTQAEDFLGRAAKCEGFGMVPLVENGSLYGAAVCIGEEDTAFLSVGGFLTEAYLKEKLKEMMLKQRISFLDLKNQIKFFGLPTADASLRKRLFDCSLASYLLNPLQSEYTYEDIAKDALNLMIPSQTDFLGKTSLVLAREVAPDAFLNCICYMAYTAWKAKDVLTEKLKETEMLTLYEEIELPLTYVLSAMEKEGIAADKTALAEYGNQLSSRIAELEKDIYAKAGEEFNINSPKQLGVILFEKLKMPYGKKTKTGYSTAAEVLDKLAPTLIQAYRQAEDIHRITASQVFHVPFDQVTDLQRRNAKAVNFGIVYGISSFGLSQDLSISKKEAAEYIERYFESYPKIKAFLDGLVASAKEKGYSLTMYKRRRPLPELSSGNFVQRSFGERVAMNAPIQGTAADIIKIAMIRVHDRLFAEGLKSQLILQVHDELLIETRQEEQDKVRRILKEEMLRAADLSVDLEVDMHSGANWYEAK